MPSRLPDHLRTALTLASVGLVAVAALSLRLDELGRPGSNYDEGVYLQSLLLMRHGFRPFVDIVSTQGALHLHLAYLPYSLGDYTLAAARMGAVGASILTLGAAALAAGVVAGRLAAVAAALVVALSPTFLWISREALPEAPAAAFAALAVAAAALATRDARACWPVLAGACLALACLTKPAVAPAAVPVFALTARSVTSRAWLWAALSAVVVGLVALIVVGGLGAFEQVIGWRVGSRQFDPSLGIVAHNVELLVDKMFRQEQPALYALTVLGAVALIARSPLIGLALTGWLAAQLGLLLAYTNLSSHLGALLVPPMAVLAGGAVTTAWTVVARRPPRVLPALAALGVVAYVMAIPALLERDERIVEGDVSTARSLSRAERRVVATIAELTPTDGWVLTDAPHLAFHANRRVPPPLVDPSEARISSGVLSEQVALRALHDYDPDLVVFWTGKLARLNGLAVAVQAGHSLVEEFSPVDDDALRAIYRDRD
jgi:hypothetical protein